MVIVDWENVPQFGDRVAGQNYKRRPGSYGVIIDDLDQIALVETKTGFHLPGGGADLGETSEQTLERELLEECGWRIHVKRRIGEAIQLVFAQGEGYFSKECVFFEGTLGDFVRDSSEKDHILQWRPAKEAVHLLKYESQKWAVTTACPMQW